MPAPELRIVPEPAVAGRKAIAAALARTARMDAPARAERSAWWRAGVGEAVAPPAPDRDRGR